MLRTWVVLMFSLLLSFHASAVNSGVTYQGRIIKPDGSPLSGQFTQFKIQVRTPDSGMCLMYEEVQSQDLRNSAGAFSLTINDGTGSRTDTTGLTLDRIFANRGSFTLDPTTCNAGPGTYAPGPSDGRDLVVLFKDETMAAWEPIPAQKINFVPFAFESKQIAGFTADSLLRVVNGSGDPLTGVSPLSNAQYTELLALANGTSTNYTKTGQLNGVALPTMNSGEVLGWNGTAWVSTAAPTPGANSITTAMIQSGAVTTSQIASNVTINTSGTLGAAVTTTRDFKIYAASPSTFYIDMQAPALTASYSMVWPLNAGTSGQVLTTDGAGNLSWTTAGTGNGDFKKDGSVAMTGALQLNRYINGGNTGNVIDTGSSAGANFDLRTADADIRLRTINNNNIIFLTNGAERSRITQTGYVGIGTTSPSRILDVSSASTDTNPVGSTGTANIAITNTDTTTNNTSDLSFIGTDLSGAGAMVGKISMQYTSHATGVQSGDMLFITRNAGAKGERMRITAAGRVGIGTTSPSAMIHLKAGTASASTAPLKFTQGVLMTTAEDGAMEYDASGLWFTMGSTRYVIPVNSSSGVYTNVSSIANAGGSITMSPAAGNSVIINSATASTSAGTGALVVNGGLGIGGDVNTTGNITTSGTITTTTTAVIPHLYGSTAANGNIKIDGSSNASVGNVLLATAGGKVGVGTTSPGYPLDVRASSGGYVINAQTSNAADNVIRVQNTAATGYSEVSAFDNSGNYMGGFGYSNPSAAVIPSTLYFGSLASRDVVLLSNNTERMRVTSAGNVGIGTTSPDSALHVVGTSHFTGSATFGGDIAFGNVVYGPQGVFTVGGNYAYSPSSASIGVPNGASVIMGDGWAVDNNFSGLTVGPKNGANHSQYFYMGAVSNTSGYSPTIVMGQQTGAATYQERLRIDTNGNVGIGTTSPTASLDVKGQIRGSVYNAGSSVAIDWNNGNSQYTAPAGSACTAMTFTNMLDGGSYTLAAQGVTSGTCTFSQAGLNFVYSPANTGVTTDAVYTFLRMGSTVYVSWTTNFQ